METKRNPTMMFNLIPDKPLPPPPPPKKNMNIPNTCIQRGTHFICDSSEPLVFGDLLWLNQSRCIYEPLRVLNLFPKPCPVLKPWSCTISSIIDCTQNYQYINSFIECQKMTCVNCPTPVPIQTCQVVHAVDKEFLALLSMFFAMWVVIALAIVWCRFRNNNPVHHVTSDAMSRFVMFLTVLVFWSFVTWQVMLRYYTSSIAIAWLTLFPVIFLTPAMGCICHRITCPDA